jgi:signal transduction histidine kinase
MSLWVVFLGFFVLLLIPIPFYFFILRFKQQKIEVKFPYQALFENLPLGLIVLDDHQTCLLTNTWFKKEFGEFHELKKMRQFQDFCQNPLLQTLEIRYRHQDYQVHKIDCMGHQAITIQLSEQKKLQDVGKDFVANASHELRTPITIIKGFAETLQDLPEISDAMLHDFTEKILRSCQRMDNLVKNLLLLADLDHSKRIHKRHSDLIALVESASYTLLSLHPDILIETFTSDHEISFLFDPDMLEQALLNLLENAVKYSPESAKITITIEKQEKGVSLKIQDKGVGIPKEHLPFIFQRFYRVNQDRSRKLGGAGLGLSIVKAIIEKHNGQIHAESERDQGTTFSLFFHDEESSNL